MIENMELAQKNSVLEEIIRKMCQFNDIQIIENKGYFPIPKLANYTLRIKSETGEHGCFFYISEETAKYLKEVLKYDR